LFGHEKGAYTARFSERSARVSLGRRHTFSSTKSTHAPQLTGEAVEVLRSSFQRLGGTKPIYVDFRLIAATNSDLQEAVTKKLFRDDLYYRLNVITMTLPELSERLSDVPLLVNYFMERYKVRSNVQSISPAAMDILLKYPWPGNVRELVNAIEYSMIMAKGTQILPTDLPEALQGRIFEPQQQTRESLSLKETERELIVRTLKECHGNKHLAAKFLESPFYALQQDPETWDLDRRES
jgi:DNA-binding NtrC family response regulator